MYSLTPLVAQQPPPPAEQKEQKLGGNPKPEFIKPPEAPSMWFNPATQRWVSTSCRTYREILRDRALVLSGLPPGPRRKKRKTRLAHTPSPTPPQTTHTIQPIYNIHSSSAPQPVERSPLLSYPEQPVVRPPPLTDKEKRDALFKKYGM